MATVSDIFETLGGVTVISNEIGIPLTTVHGWKRSGFVPRWRVPALVNLASRKGVPLSEDAVPVRGAAPANRGELAA